MKNDFIVILVTCSSMKEAKVIVDALLKKRLIACGNIVSGIHSKFWWKAKIDSAKEILVIMKSRKMLFGRLEKEIRRIHNYEVPEIIAIPVACGSKRYLDWMRSETCRVS